VGAEGAGGGEWWWSGRREGSKAGGCEGRRDGSREDSREGRREDGREADGVMRPVTARWGGEDHGAAEEQAAAGGGGQRSPSAVQPALGGAGRGGSDSRYGTYTQLCCPPRGSALILWPPQGDRALGSSEGNGL